MGDATQPPMDGDATTGGDASGADTGGGAADGSDSGPAKRFACPPGPFPTPAAGASQMVCDTFAFKYNLQDGPTWVPSEQAFFFSNYVQGAAGPGDIIKYTPGGQCEVWLAGVGCNGLTAAYDGTLVAACQTARAVVAFDLTTKQPTTLASMYGGQPLDSPNDIVAHSSGAIFFTNPTYELGSRPQGVGPAEFVIDSSGTLKLIAKVQGGQPNGIALSPDEKHLYVEQDSVGVKVYDLDPSGMPSSSSRPFAGTTDGISVDCAGNVYLSGGAIIGPDGTQVASFPGGGSMAAFGGADGTTLLVVGAGGGTGVYTVPMNVPGPPH
jgi:gluconolactonase